MPRITDIKETDTREILRGDAKYVESKKQKMEHREERIRTLKGNTFAPKCLYIRIEGTIVSKRCKAE